MPYIKKLKLQGFKSFAKETEIPFEKNMNIFVGANGAGKSNLVDSICFVLGRLSIKSIRAAKAANLIYNGGKNNRPASQAIVQLVIDNTDKTFPLSNEVLIERTVKTDGTSRYRINDKTKTRQEVLELLAHAGIDPYGFNLILQGEIERFVKMHPEERRAVIEEVAGISVYEQRKEKSLRELEKTDEKLRQVNTILAERIAYLHNLDKERQQALHYKRLEKSVKICEASLIFKQLSERKKEQERIDNNLKKQEEVRKKQEEASKILQEKISSLNTKIEEINEQVEKASGIEQAELHTELTQAKADTAVLSVKIENYKNQIKTLEERTLQLEKNLERTKEELVKLEEEKKLLKVKEEKIDFASFKKELVELANNIKQENEKLVKLDNTLIENVKRYRTEIRKLLQVNTKDSTKEAAKKLDLLSEILLATGKKINLAFSLLKNTEKKMQSLLAREVIKEISAERDVFLEISLKQREIQRIGLIIKRSKKEKDELLEQIVQLEKQLETQQDITEEKEKKEGSLYKNFQNLFTRRNVLHKELRKNEPKLFEKQASIKKISDEINSLRIAKAKIDAEAETREKQFVEYEKYRDVIIKASSTEIEKRLERNKEALSKIGDVNMRALQEYDNVKQEYDKIDLKVKKLQEEKQEILKIIEEIDRKKRKSFMSALNSINSFFSRNFIMLSNKHAFLELENKQEPFAAGLDITVRLSKGRYLDATALSGGEQTIVALSLIFAIQEYKPYCFYILDEVDAALDKRNSERLVGLLKRYIGKAQYIIITHNDALITEANTIYGCSMQDGVSKVLSLKV